MPRDKLQVSLFLAGNKGRSDERFAQNYGFKEHIRPGLAHHNIGSRHIRRNLPGKWKGIQVFHSSKTPEQGTIHPRGKDHLHSLIQCQQPLCATPEVGCTITAALQEDRKAIRVQTETSERFCTAQPTGTIELTTNRPAYEWHMTGVEAVSQHQFTRFASGCQGSCRISFRKPCSVYAIWIGEQHHKWLPGSVFLKHTPGCMRK